MLMRIIGRIPYQMSREDLLQLKRSLDCVLANRQSCWLQDGGLAVAAWWKIVALFAKTLSIVLNDFQLLFYNLIYNFLIFPTISSLKKDISVT